ncbi:hypothetical protein EWM64_g3141 [Hericium alpestre]|uniref:Cytochrome P450 n=1 Tax=Hericium alpestre TaxID=135208 RepID=A0A4Z0A1A8_9AGAM|nr:hypothetical protein EWM64_g3141 [Hericium alpestre]
MALMQYGEEFREHRRMLHRLVGTTASVEKFSPIEERETHRFLRRVLQQPDTVPEQIRRTAGAIILMISHGYQVKEDKDTFTTTAEQAVEGFSKSTEPGAFLVDVLPILRYVPDWLPGSGWRRTANAWAADLARMADAPHDFVKQQMGEGKALPSFTSAHLEEHLTPEQEFNIKWAAADIYSGGADTTVSAIHSFFLAMTLHPELQRKAQLEIDVVIGHDRLPTLKDRANLPYVDALVKECLRWYPVSNLGVPHRVAQDDTYNGYLIPKGTYVIANLWKFMHDPEIYRNPHDFHPDRYIASEGKEGELDPRTLAFGFGRRVCPGIKLADISLWISCAMSLAVFDISKKVLNGRVIEPVVDYQSGTISHPKPFECSIKPRSEKALELINSVDLFED